MPPAQIGCYRVERLLGTGSFATVWLGFDPSLGARVAIKVLADNWSHDPRVRERFLDEGRLLWRLDHHRVVRVHSLGELPDGRPYLVMAWADGGSLRDRLAAGPVPVERGLRLLREIAAGVAVLHEHGIVHRDLTPGNILFRSRPGSPEPAEQVLIADLGLAKALAAASGLTARAGTPGYMAPEQDEPLAVVDARTDVYGLGRLGVRLLGAPASADGSGSSGGSGRSGGYGNSGGSGEHVRLRRGVPLPVAGVLRRATRPRPADRYPDAAAFATALDRAVTAPPRPAGGPARRPVTVLPRRHRVLATGLVSAALLALAADSSEEPGTATDSTRRITVALPAGWRAAGSGWQGVWEPDGDPAPALVLSPHPRQWVPGATAPGAFVGLVRGAGAATPPATFLAGRLPTGCTATPARSTRQAGIDWVVVRYTACPGGRPVLVQAAGAGPGDAGLVYVQLAPPTGAGPGFVDTLLAGVRVR